MSGICAEGRGRSVDVKGDAPGDQNVIESDQNEEEGPP